MEERRVKKKDKMKNRGCKVEAKLKVFRVPQEKNDLVISLFNTISFEFK